MILFRLSKFLTVFFLPAALFFFVVRVLLPFFAQFAAFATATWRVLTHCATDTTDGECGRAENDDGYYKKLKIHNEGLELRQSAEH